MSFLLGTYQTSAATQVRPCTSGPGSPSWPDPTGFGRGSINQYFDFACISGQSNH